MTNEDLERLAQRFGIKGASFDFLRHNENETYKVNAGDGRKFVLRIHQPFQEEMSGKQHTYEGLLGELHMLEELSRNCSLSVQTPIRDTEGNLITVVEHNGRQLNCSMLSWLEGRDLNITDVSHPELVRRLGSQIGELHTFFRGYYHKTLENRPSQGMAYNQWLAETVRKGLCLGLFTASDVDIVDETLREINELLAASAEAPSGMLRLVHGDLGLGNVIISPEGIMSFIDFGFFGQGYELLDVAMGAMMVPPEHRDVLLDGYYEVIGRSISPEDRVLLEGFALVAIIGYYAFQMPNETVHDWMRERMPRLCAEYCKPFLQGERIFSKV
jgi:Ser/Thr protein kinase RdoA (MazF antagonist)